MEDDGGLPFSLPPSIVHNSPSLGPMTAPVHVTPTLGPMTGAIHNISARNLHDISTTLPDDRQFLRSWRRQLQDSMTQQSGRIVRFLVNTGSDVSGTSISELEISRRCADVLHKYSRPTWNFASSVRDLMLNTSTAETLTEIEREIGVSPAALRETLKRTIRMYINTAAALSASEVRLEEKLRRLETVIGRINDMLFMEPTPELEALAGPTRAYLDSVLDKISIEADYTELVEHYKKFATLKGLVSLMSFQRSPTPTCTICMTKEISHAVTPCGHTFCEDCCRSQMTACYICRVQIRDRLRLFFS
jgi:hypothetical protein